MLMLAIKEQKPGLNLRLPKVITSTFVHHKLLSVSEELRKKAESFSSPATAKTF